jgi:hypothetical protein
MLTSHTKWLIHRMAVIALAGALVAPLTTVTYAQEDTTSPEDLGKYQALVDSGVFPTAGNVERARLAALSAFDSGQCERALPLIDEWTRMANWHANLITAGLEPFYGALSSERNDWFGRQTAERRSSLVELERSANRYRSQRNLGMVMRAECLAAVDLPLESLATFARALDLIGIDETELWMRAQTGLYELIELALP